MSVDKLDQKNKTPAGICSREECITKLSQSWRPQKEDKEAHLAQEEEFGRSR